ncbi:peptidase, membrane zinc metallopeptidase [[Clostridium] cellulosi]|uniref:Peptidase, membrane zinc metallopeptidase n=1 Tax=[Clostridium] cellulosi TaxID=29343 RepID=A0A078KL38_9FIRM|nr:peptidase, membrane zinc metallopeptidase [[Clostridium] cellulosi]
MHLFLYGYFTPYFFYDRYYIIYVLPALILALIAQFNVTSTFSRYSRIPNSRRMSGAEAARRILDQNGLYNVRVERISGNLSDHYDPKDQVVRLSEGVYDGYSIAALGVAAHETGHAIQHSTNYSPLVIRNAIIPITQFGSSTSIWLLIIGFIFNWRPLVMAGIILFSLAVVFQLITLPVEFNASSRALKILGDTGMLYGQELAGARRVLTAAALTYVAATVVAFAQLLRLLAIFGNTRDD